MLMGARGLKSVFCCALNTRRRYNDPGTLPPFRRNEVLVALREPYDLWRPGEVEEVRRNAGV